MKFKIKNKTTAPVEISTAAGQVFTLNVGEVSEEWISSAELLNPHSDLNRLMGSHIEIVKRKEDKPEPKVPVHKVVPDPDKENPDVKSSRTPKAK